MKVFVPADQESGRRIKEAAQNAPKRFRDFKPFKLEGQVKINTPAQAKLFMLALDSERRFFGERILAATEYEGL